MWPSALPLPAGGHGCCPLPFSLLLLTAPLTAQAPGSSECVRTAELFCHGPSVPTKLTGHPARPQPWWTAAGKGTPGHGLRGKGGGRLMILPFPARRACVGARVLGGLRRGDLTPALPPSQQAQELSDLCASKHPRHGAHTATQPWRSVTAGT